MIKKVKMLGQMDYNVILGMDWLAAYHASVDIYKEKFFFIIIEES